MSKKKKKEIKSRLLTVSFLGQRVEKGGRGLYLWIQLVPVCSCLGVPGHVFPALTVDLTPHWCTMCIQVKSLVVALSLQIETLHFTCFGFGTFAHHVSVAFSAFMFFLDRFWVVFFFCLVCLKHAGKMMCSWVVLYGSRHLMTTSPIQIS